MGKLTQTTSGVTVGHVATFSDVHGNIQDGGSAPFVPAGLTVSITTAKLTTGGTEGQMSFLNGILTAQTPAT